MKANDHEEGEALPEPPDSQMPAGGATARAPADCKATAARKRPGPASLAAIPAMELCMRRALAGFFRSGGSPIREFLLEWQGYRWAALDFPEGENWESCQDKGQHLLSLFLLDEVPWKISGVQAVWKRYAVKVSGKKTPREGILDLVAAVEGVMSVVLFRVRVEPPLSLPADLACELAAALQAEPLARQAVACLFATHPAPRIQWRRVEPAVKVGGQ